MGRNAKFYKKTKSRTSRAQSGKDVYDDADDNSDVEAPRESKPVAKHQPGSKGRLQQEDLRLAARKQALLAQQRSKKGRGAAPSRSSAPDHAQGQQRVLMLGTTAQQREGLTSAAATSTASSQTNPKLKSKLWKSLEAQRAAEGKGEIATPREAGIDYLAQWESKRIGKGKGR